MASGRKREFDSKVALTAAMYTFWQKGYFGTSLSDLIDTMGINKPSMYRAFGNKAALFVKTTHHYLETQVKPHLALLEQPNVNLKQRLKNHLMSIITMQTDPQRAYGCYLVLAQSEYASGNLPDEAKQVLAQAEAMQKRHYYELFTTEPEAINLGLNNNAKANALSILTLLKGTAAMARSGATKAELEYSVDSILKGIGFTD